MTATTGDGGAARQMGAWPSCKVALADALLVIGSPPGASASRASLTGLGYEASNAGRSLSGIDRELKRMATVARSVGITDIRKLSSRGASREPIREALREPGAGTGRNDLTLVYSSEQGSVAPGRGRLDEPAGQAEGLLRFDARSVDNSLESAVSDDDLGGLLGKIGTHRLLLVADAGSSRFFQGIGRPVARCRSCNLNPEGRLGSSPGGSQDVAPVPCGGPCRLIGIMATPGATGAAFQMPCQRRSSAQSRTARALVLGTAKIGTGALSGPLRSWRERKPASGASQPVPSAGTHAKPWKWIHGLWYVAYDDATNSRGMQRADRRRWPMQTDRVQGEQRRG